MQLTPELARLRDQLLALGPKRRTSQQDALLKELLELEFPNQQDTIRENLRKDFTSGASGPCRCCGK